MACPSAWTTRIALYIMGELCEGVHFAHELRGTDGQPTGLVHRDISPDNVLLSYAGEVKLSDFGVAKRRTDNSLVSSLKGNLAYMSPEQARGAALDRRSDIYSLGAVLFELLTGYPLRDSSNQAETWRQVASGLVFSPQQRRPDLPPHLARLIADSLAPDPRDRFPDARLFCQRLSRGARSGPAPGFRRGHRIEAPAAHAVAVRQPDQAPAADQSDPAGARSVVRPNRARVRIFALQGNLAGRREAAPRRGRPVDQPRPPSRPGPHWPVRRAPSWLRLPR